MDQNNLYRLIHKLKEKEGRKLKIICDWDEVLKPREATVYHIVANRSCSFAEFFRKFWENVSVKYQGHTCRVLNTNLEEVEQLREKNPEEFRKKVEEIARTYINLYEESPWLSIAEDLLKALKEDLVDYFVIAGNYKKNRHNEVNIDKTCGGDPRKIKKFLKSFASFSNAIFVINAPIHNGQEEIKFSRPEWIRNNYPDFDLFIDDNPNNISGTRNIFSSDSSKIYVLPDYETNKNVQGENVFRVMVKPILLKDEDFSFLTLDWEFIHRDFTPELIQTWTNLNFTYPQVQEWANAFGTNFNPQDHEFINWLTNTKNLTPEETLNHHNLESLKIEFEQSQTQAQIIHNPPKSN